jgi:hypothetical protein
VKNHLIRLELNGFLISRPDKEAAQVKTRRVFLGHLILQAGNANRVPGPFISGEYGDEWRYDRTDREPVALEEVGDPSPISGSTA